MCWSEVGAVNVDSFSDPDCRNASVPTIRVAFLHAYSFTASNKTIGAPPSTPKGCSDFSPGCSAARNERSATVGTEPIRNR